MSSSTAGRWVPAGLGAALAIAIGVALSSGVAARDRDSAGDAPGVPRAGLAEPTDPPGFRSPITVGEVDAAGEAVRAHEPVVLFATVFNAEAAPLMDQPITFLGALGAEAPRPIASGVVDVGPNASARVTGTWTPDRAGAWHVAAALADQSATGSRVEVVVLGTTTGDEALAGAQALDLRIVLAAVVLLVGGAVLVARLGTTLFRR